MTYFLAFVASFFYIFTKSFQQLNVFNKQYFWILPTSLTMACMEAYIVVTTAHNGFGWLVLFIGMGGGLGSMASVWLHDKMFNKGESK